MSDSVYVYVHITPNNKLYFGITNMKPKNRWSEGKGYSSQKLFWRAIQKYGWDNIQHIILLEGLSREVACECEKYLINKYQSNNTNYGYNLTKGGEGISGYKFSEEHCKKQSVRMKGHSTSQETRAKIGKANSVALRGRTLPEEVKEKLRGKPSAMKGRHHTEEAKRKNALAHMGKQYHLGHKASDESRNRMSVSHKGQVLSEHNKKLLLETCAKAKQDPLKEAQRREKIRQAHLGKKKKPWSAEARKAHELANEKRKQQKVADAERLHNSRT